MYTPWFSFACGRHSLTGTYEEQLSAYAEIARIRDELEANGLFKDLQLKEEETPNPELSLATRIWRTRMDLVWEEYCRRHPERVQK